MNAFVTGSRVYGTPTPESDIDLCVCLTVSEMNALASCSDKDPGSMPDSLCFGKLNLLILEPWKFAAWKRGTDALIARKPVTREEAVKVLDQEEINEKRLLKDTPCKTQNLHEPAIPNSSTPAALT